MAKGFDYGAIQHLPLGITAHVVKVVALEQVVKWKEGYCEVWPGYFTQGKRFACYFPSCRPEHAAPWLRLTLDYPEDYEMFQRIYAYLYREGTVFSLDDVLDFLAAYPEIASINQRVVMQYAENIKHKTDIRWGEELEDDGGLRSHTGQLFGLSH